MSPRLYLADTTELLNRSMKVREQVFTIEKQIPKSVEVDELDCLQSESDHFVVEMDKKDVCALRCKKRGDGTVQIQRFCVLKDYRKAGIGRWTLEQIEKYYWEKDIQALVLDSKFAVSGFYERCGYVVVSEPFMEAGVEHVTMEKRRTFG